METHWSRRSSWPQPLFDDCWQIGIDRTVRCTRGQKHQQLENAIGLGSPSVRWKHSLTIVILFAHTEPFGWQAWMRLLIAGFAFAVVLANLRVHPADLEAPGLKFVSPGIA
jgi:hypothetical protein